MKFLTMITTSNPEKAGPPPPALFQAIGELAMQAGKSLGENGGMKTTSIHRVKSGELITDGPFTEAREIIGGFAFYELESAEEAAEMCRKFIELHRKHWPQWEGEVIARQLMSMPM